jgi:hypothetical protein
MEVLYSFLADMMQMENHLEIFLNMISVRKEGIYLISVARYSWIQRDVRSISNRHGHSAVIYQKSMWIFGGVCKGKLLHDLYQYSISININNSIHTDSISQMELYYCKIRN